MAELVATAGAAALPAAASAAAAKKSKKTAALNEAPRFGRVKTNLKVRWDIFWDNFHIFLRGIQNFVPN